MIIFDDLLMIRKGKIVESRKRRHKFQKKLNLSRSIEIWNLHFQLRTFKRDYSLMADSRSEAELWKEKIEQALSQWSSKSKDINRRSFEFYFFFIFPAKILWFLFHLKSILSFVLAFLKNLSSSISLKYEFCIYWKIKKIWWSFELVPLLGVKIDERSWYLKKNIIDRIMHSAIVTVFNGS